MSLIRSFTAARLDFENRKTMTDIWRAPAHVYCDMKGNIVDSTHPDCHKILIGKGDAISMARAVALGLTEMPAKVEAEVEEAKAVEKTDYALFTKPRLIAILKERGIKDFEPNDKKEFLVTLCERTEPPKGEDEE